MELDCYVDVVKKNEREKWVCYGVPAYGSLFRRATHRIDLLTLYGMFHASLVLSSISAVMEPCGFHRPRHDGLENSDEKWAIGAWRKLDARETRRRRVKWCGAPWPLIAFF